MNENKTASRQENRADRMPNGEFPGHYKKGTFDIETSKVGGLTSRPPSYLSPRRLPRQTYIIKNTLSRTPPRGTGSDLHALDTLP